MDWISDQGFGPSSAITNNNYKQPPLEACQLQASCKHGGPDPASRLEKGKIVTLPETIMEVEQFGPWKTNCPLQGGSAQLP